MGWNDHVDFGDIEVIEQAVEQGLLEEGTPPHGIALKVAHEGLESLSPKQRHVYNKHVLPALAEIAEDNANNERMNMAVLD